MIMVILLCTLLSNLKSCILLWLEKVEKKAALSSGVFLPIFLLLCYQVGQSRGYITLKLRLWNKKNYEIKRDVTKIILKGSIHQENTKILSVFVPNNIFKICIQSKMSASERRSRQSHNETWRRAHSSLISQRSSRKKIDKDQEVLKNTIN